MIPTSETSFLRASPDLQLLLACSSPRFAARLDRLDVPISAAILSLAETHGIRPLLWRALKQCSGLTCDPGLREQLREAVARTTRRNLFLTAEMLKVASLFEAHGVRCASFKGPALAQSIYGTLAAREFIDIDFIVPQADFGRAADLLRSIGFESESSADLDAAFRTGLAQIAFRDRATGALVDLHWAFSPHRAPFPLEANEIWPHLRRISTGGQSVATLGIEDLGLMLLGHGTKEGWRKVKWLADLAHFQVSNPDLDWDRMVRRASEKHCLRGVLLGLLLTSELMGVPGPQTKTTEGKHSAASRALASYALERMAVSPLLPTGGARELKRRLECYDRPADRLAVAVRALSTRTLSDYAGMPLPRPLWPLYRLTRWGRLAFKAARYLLKRAGL